MVQLRTECMFQYDNKFMTHYIRSLLKKSIYFRLLKNAQMLKFPNPTFGGTKE